MPRQTRFEENKRNTKHYQLRDVDMWSSWRPAIIHIIIKFPSINHKKTIMNWVHLKLSKSRQQINCKTINWSLITCFMFYREVIQWMQNPTPQSQMGSFAEWKTCDTVWVLNNYFVYSSLENYVQFKLILKLILHCISVVSIVILTPRWVCL